MNALAGQRFWLIGASVGIGRQLALCLAREGAAVVASSRDHVSLERLVEEMMPVDTIRGGHLALPLDVTDRTSVSKACRQAGESDGVIYCAGAYEPMSAYQPDIVHLETMVDVNFTGALRILATCVPEYRRRGTGHIVLVGSLSGYRGLPSAWGYGATKAALIHLAQNLRCDLRGSGVRVQICNPGFVKTRLTDKNDFKMPFIVTPEEAAKSIVSGMKRRHFEMAFPWPMAVIFKLLAVLPRSFYFALLAIAGGRSNRIT